MTPAQIKEEIKKHLTLVADLRAQMNSFLPVCRIPPEILATIFTHGARDYYYQSINYRGFHVPCWVNVSYVCRHWRDAALNCPVLWTYHFIASLRWTEELLARSKQAPLTTRVYFDQGRRSTFWSGLVKKLFDHAERIQELHLRVPLNVLPSSQLSLHTPHLQVLGIEGTYIPLSKRTLTINHQDIPPLRTLKLTDCSLPWHMLDLSKLTALFLCHVPTPQHIAEFLASLPRMHGLTVLHLDRALASAREFLSSGASDVSPQIGLPCLARLHVVAPLSTVIALLSRVNIPFKTEVKLQFQIEGSSVEDYARIPSVLAQRFSPSNDLSSFSPTIRSLAINFDRYQFALCASEHDTCHPHECLEFSPWGSGISLMIHIEKEPSMRKSDWNHIASDICCSIPSMSIQALSVIDPPFSRDFWKKTLSHLHGLRKMDLNEGNMPDLASLLSLVSDEQAETPKGPATGDGDPVVKHTYVPALEKLGLCRISFAHEESEIRNRAPRKALFDALATRKALRRQLTVESCDVEGEDLYSEDDNSDYSY